MEDQVRGAALPGPGKPVICRPLILGTQRWPGNHPGLTGTAALRPVDQDREHRCPQRGAAFERGQPDRGDLALGGALGGDAESAVGRTLSDSHFVAMFPALARARLELRRARTGLAPGVRLRRRLERGRYGAGRVELAAALVTAVAAGRIYPDAAGHQAAAVHPGGTGG
jgi:hypothetical protein